MRRFVKAPSPALVISIIALVMGLLVGPRVMRALVHSKDHITRLKLRQLANDAMPRWQTDHADTPCPRGQHMKHSPSNRSSAHFGTSFFVSSSLSTIHKAGVWSVVGRKTAIWACFTPA